MKKALLFGASGFVGSFLLKELLLAREYDRVTVVVRKELVYNDPKLKQLVGDYGSLPGLADAIEADDVFIALGTTKKKTPDKRQYYTVDHDYPVLAARIARERGASSVFLVSAVGANPESGIFYVRTKGETERDVISLGFEDTHIFRPSIIMGERPESRPLETLWIRAWSVINPLLAGGLARFRGMEAPDIAGAMVAAAAKPGSPEVAIYQWPEMNALLQGRAHANPG